VGIAERHKVAPKMALSVDVDEAGQEHGARS